jgi:hypothetical protein
VSSSLNPTCIPFTCFASRMLKNFSSIWFLCKHVDVFDYICDNLILNIDALSVATNMLNNFSFLCFVCNHIATWDMNCHMCYHFESIGVASMMKTIRPDLSRCTS